jgi:signal transduction histidine kinase
MSSASVAPLDRAHAPASQLVVQSRSLPATAAVTESLLADPGFVRLIRWVFTARLLCLALAAPAALLQPEGSVVAPISLCMLTVSSLMLSRSDRLIRMLIRHPLLASIDVAIAVALVISIAAGQPGALTVVCSALAAGLLFPARVLIVLMVPLAVGSFGAPAAVLDAPPDRWHGWLALIAGLPILVVGVCIIGAVIRHHVVALLQARHEVAEAVAVIGAADERARLAREMHDSVGKSLHGISLGAKALSRAAERDAGQARELATSLAEAADQAAREARTLLVALRKGQTDQPTIDVIREVVARWQQETKVPARLSTVHAVDAAPFVTRQMTAALEEILHNIGNHAAASGVEVELTGDSRFIELIVADDGIGFDTDRAAAREADGHFGLRGLRERAALVGGEVEITSAKRKGTRVRWTALRQPEQA